MPALQIRFDGTARLFPLTKDLTVLGRDQSNDVLVDDQKASRNHCQIEHVAQGWKLTDLSSRNGTRLNGKTVKAHLLQHGDRIEIGAKVFVFLDLAEGAVPGATLDLQAMEGPPPAAPLIGEPDAPPGEPDPRAESNEEFPESGSHAGAQEAQTQGVRFSCPACGSRMHCNASFAGRVVTCSCGSKVRIPRRPEVILEGVPEPDFSSGRERPFSAPNEDAQVHDKSGPLIDASLTGQPHGTGALYWIGQTLKYSAALFLEIVCTPGFAKLVGVAVLLLVIYGSFRSCSESMDRVRPPSGAGAAAEPEWCKVADAAKFFIGRHLGSSMERILPISESMVIRDKDDAQHWNISMVVEYRDKDGRLAQSQFLMSLRNEGENWRMDSTPLEIHR